MSRRRRDRGDSPDDLLSELEENETPSTTATGFTASNIADEAYGSAVGVNDPFANLGRDRIKITPRPIDQITPDVIQPRRVIPFVVRHHWNGKSDFASMANLFNMWLAEAHVERGNKSLPIDEILYGRANERTEVNESLTRVGEEPTTGPIESSLTRVIDLAASIRRDGLTNAITIAAENGQFIIETGERRWLAYHLLYWRLNTLNNDDQHDWTRIPAHVVDELSIWRQASENNARADLNAIGKARQFALLLMDMFVQEGVKFRHLDNYQNDQAFYAQVADGTEFPIPRNMSEKLLNAMGLKNAVQLRQYRALLRIPFDLWQHADDHNLTEGEIRKLVQKADTVTRVTPDRSTLEQFRTRTLETLRRQWSDLTPRERKQALSELEALIDDLRADL